jgi:hypothetical protein
MTSSSARYAFFLAASVPATLLVLGIQGCGKDTSVAPLPAPDVLANGVYIGDSADQPNGYWYPRRNFIAVAPDGAQQDYFLIGPRAEALEAVHQARGGIGVPARIEGVDTGNRPTNLVGDQSIEVELIDYELVER